MFWRTFGSGAIMSVCLWLLATGAAAAGTPASRPATRPQERYKMQLTTQAIEERIRKNRTADVALTVTDANGTPLPGAAVTVRQVRHKFLFGCNAFFINANDDSELQKAYRLRYADLLNYATMPFYWGAYEPAEGLTGEQRVKGMAKWCAESSIRTKGHPLCWHSVDPRWLKDKTLDDIQTLQLARITREVKAFTGLVDTWDVVNEAVAMPSFQKDTNPISRLCNKLGNVELIKQTFAAARAANPKATLLLNDFDTSPKYEKLIADCLAAGVTIDVIGIQSHQHMGYWGAEKAWDVCERFSKFGKPLHFTETTLISGDRKKDLNWQGRYDDWKTTEAGEKLQAEQVAEFYTVLFSHPAVEGITWWDFSDHRAWLGAPSGLVRADMSPKPAYEALMKLVKKDWWTGEQKLTTDASGKVAFRGFLGAYAVEAAGGKGQFAVDKAGSVQASVQVK
jgi:GH35 family endo-1,4-beta-xylanase